mgnify:CR=1 FL=1
MLTKPQSFLREVANTCFKFFCVDCVNDANLMSLLTIVSTANAEADDIMDADGKGQEDDGEEEGEEEMEDGESSDSDNSDWPKKLKN